MTALGPSAPAPAPVPSATAAGRPRQRWLGLVPLVVLVAVVLALVIVRTQRPAPTAAAAVAPTLDTAAIVAAATTLPPGVLDAIGTGGVVRVPTAINGATVTDAGKPRIVWSGAEYCPTCAAMRWSLVIALSRFGTFDGLTVTASSTREPYPDTPTFTFRAATYRSELLSFTSYETASSTYVSGRYEPLMTPSPADQQLLAAYDGPPYFPETTPSDPNGSPFILFAGQYASTGSLYTPGVLDGLDATQLAQALTDPGSSVARAVDGTANVLTAALCSTTGETPSAVCGSAGVAAARQLVSARTS